MKKTIGLLAMLSLLPLAIHFGKWFWDKSKNDVPLDFKL